MKIAYFLDNQQYVGGAGNLLLQYARLMASLHDVTVIIPSTDDGVVNTEYVSRCDNYGLKHHSLIYYTFHYFEIVDLFGSLKYVDEIYDYLVSNKIEMVHCVQLNPTVEMAARKAGVPSLMSIYQLSDAEFRIKMGDFYPHYHLCDSKKYSMAWEKNAGVVSRYIRPVSPVDGIVKKAKNDEVYTLLSLGRVCPRKNQLTAIKITERLVKSRKVKLIIAGELVEQYAKECMEYVSNHSLSAFIEFRGFVSDVGQLMGECDCLWCTSNDESFPSSIVEAVSYGLDIVTTPAGGISEVFEDGVNAYVSADYEESNIEQSVKRYLESCEDGQISNIREGALKTWQEAFARQAVRLQLDDYYNYIVSRKEIRCIDQESIDGAYYLMGKMVAADRELANFRSRILYFLKLSKILNNQTIYIWGAGKFGKAAYEFISNLYKNIRIIGFLDTQKTGDYLGIEVFYPEVVKNKPSDLVIIAYGGDTRETLDYLSEQGYVLNQSMWHFR